MSTAAQQDRLQVVLVGTRNPLNIGAAARAMSNFGFRHLRVVHPYELAFREARSAVGAAALLRDAQEYQSISEAVADCSLVVGTSAVGSRRLELPVHHLKAGADSIRRHLRSAKVALLFGSEKVGLSNDNLSLCHFVLHIPTHDKHLSMNLGQAVAVCLYELIRVEPLQIAAVKRPSATAGDLGRITHLFLEAATRSGYASEKSAGLTEAKLRRLVRRLKLSSDDATVLLGFFRQILWKLKSRE